MKKVLLWLLSPRVGGAIGIIGFAFAIYTAFFLERKPEISVSVEAMSKVFDLHHPVGGLEFSYEGDDLRSSKKNLWVLTATFKNTGNAEIRKIDYDDKAPLGLEILGAVIAEQPTIKTNIDYLAKNLTVSGTQGLIAISPVIIEPGESFEVTALLLGSESARPSVMPVGKLAGVRSIILTTPENPSPEKSIFSQAIESTSPWVHLLRGVIYSLGLLIVFGLIVALFSIIKSPIVKFKENRAAAERQKRMRNYRRNEELDRESRYLADEYVARGDAGLARIARYLRAHEKRRVLFDLLDGKVGNDQLERIIKSAEPFLRNESRTQEALKSIKLIEGSGINPKVPKELGDALNNLCGFLEININTISSRVDWENWGRSDFAFEVSIGKVEDNNL